MVSSTVLAQVTVTQSKTSLPTNNHLTMDHGLIDRIGTSHSDTIEDEFTNQ
jgi:hypothetical protein